MFKFRVIAFFVFVGIYSLSYQIGGTTEVSFDEANDFVQNFLSSTQSSDGLGFFFNNITAALPMFIPAGGIIVGIYSAWSTGFGFAAITTMAPALAGMEPLGVLYYTPYGIMEVVAYSIAMSRSLIVGYLLAKRKNPIPLIKPSLIEVGIVVAILLVAGLLEEYMIGLSQQGM